MPEEIIPQPSSAPKPEVPSILPEADMDRLAGEIAKHKENPEFAGVAGQEIVKQALKTVAPVTPQPQPSDPNAQYLPNYVSDAPQPTKMEIEHLLEIAVKEGLAKANALASKSNPFVLDAFHDALSGKLYPELQKRKLVD
jgi:hypothetical protein